VPSDLLLQKFAGYSLVFFLDFLPGQVEMHHYSVYNLAQTQALRRTHTQVPFQIKKMNSFFWTLAVAWHVANHHRQIPSYSFCSCAAFASPFGQLFPPLSTAASNSWAKMHPHNSISNA
jgi:hypothetical protein